MLPQNLVSCMFCSTQYTRRTDRYSRYLFCSAKCRVSWKNEGDKLKAIWAGQYERTTIGKAKQIGFIITIKKKEIIANV